MDLLEAARKILMPLGYEVLELSIRSAKKKRRVLLRIDRLDENPVAMEDVSLATNVFSLELDRLDPFDTPYHLDVESPGAKRPLVTKRHFERFHDLLAQVQIQGDTFKGVIREVSDEQVTFEVEGEARSFPISDVQARLAEWPSEPR